jgi:hypothetical protein
MCSKCIPFLQFNQWPLQNGLFSECYSLWWVCSFVELSFICTCRNKYSLKMMVFMLGCFSKDGPCGRQFFHLFGLFSHWQCAYFQFIHTNARLWYCTHVLELYCSSYPCFYVRFYPQIYIMHPIFWLCLVAVNPCILSCIYCFYALKLHILHVAVMKVMPSFSIFVRAESCISLL